jgi:hypothetical protein
VLRRFKPTNPMPHFNDTRYGADKPTAGSPPLSILLLDALARNKEWIAVFFFSGFMETVRGIVTYLWHKVLSYFLITAVFDDHNDCYGTFIVINRGMFD